MSHPTTLLLLRTIVPFSALFYPKPPLLSGLRFCRFYPPFLSIVVPSRPFVSRPLAPRSYYPFSHRATLKLAFSLLSSEAADFPHFTFQSHGGCDFLPHFHSNNIEGTPTSSRSEGREQKRRLQNFIDSIVEKRTNKRGTNGRAKRERMRH